MKDKARDHITLTLRSDEHVGSNGYLALDVSTSAHGIRHYQTLQRICVLVCVFSEALIELTLKVYQANPVLRSE